MSNPYSEIFREITEPLGSSIADRARAMSMTYQAYYDKCSGRYKPTPGDRLLLILALVAVRCDDDPRDLLQKAVIEKKRLEEKAEKWRKAK